MVAAGYFDGASSRRHPVQLQAEPHGLLVVGEGWQRQIAADAIRVSEPIGGAPRTLTFPQGDYCEAAQGEELNALLTALGHRDGAVARWQLRWTIALASLVLLAVLALAGYRWGLPWLAARVAPRIPPALVTLMSDQVMQLLDRRALRESALAPERQEAIEGGFRRLIADDAALHGGRLLFRAAPALGANAFALPDGRIVLFDELVALAEEDDEVLGILAHELGHVKFRHGLRQLLQSSVVAAIAASVFGDVSSLLSGLTTLLLESKYSRVFELEADDFGAALMRHHGGSAEGMARMLEKLELAHDQGRGGEQSRLTWLASHPEVARRVERLRERR
ncbi:MAG: hypothetical protein BWK76_26550 [Desulfobulbaceae bacterium A2]|nr:MAG: hypothetical protein BWK76_26550 [Desulfobulbaceae bacterium A2]